MWRGSKLQHPSRSHPSPAPALPAAASQGRGEGYCELRSSACFIHGRLHSTRIFLPESFKQNLNTNYLGVKKRKIIRKLYSQAQQTLTPSSTAGLSWVNTSLGASRQFLGSCFLNQHSCSLAMVVGGAITEFLAVTPFHFAALQPAEL